MLSYVVTKASKFYNRNFDLISKFKNDLKTLLRQGISQPDFYGDVIYKLGMILGHCHFSVVFTKIIKLFIKRGYDPTIRRPTACLVFNTFFCWTLRFPLLITSDIPSEILYDGQFLMPYGTEWP
jgi:hypothetical protein